MEKSSGMAFLGTSDTDSDKESDKLNSLTSDSDILPCCLGSFFVLVYSIKFNKSGVTVGPHKGYISSRKRLLRNPSNDLTGIKLKDLEQSLKVVKGHKIQVQV